MEGQVKLNTTPGATRMPGEFPAYHKSSDAKLSEDDLAGTYEIDVDSLRKDQDPDILDSHGKQQLRKRIVPVQKKRGVE